MGDYGTEVMYTTLDGDKKLRILAQGRWEWRRVYYKKADSICPICHTGFSHDQPVYYVTHPAYWREYFICTTHELGQEVMTLG